jgi:uncharacterized membrane protein YkvA (DUF1232 family)
MHTLMVWITNMIKRIFTHLRNIWKDRRLLLFLVRNPRAPMLSKVLIGLAAAYIILPFDFASDLIPVVGQLDDLIIVPLLLNLALKVTPRELIEQGRNRKLSSREEP